MKIIYCIPHSVWEEYRIENCVLYTPVLGCSSDWKLYIVYPSVWDVNRIENYILFTPQILGWFCLDGYFYLELSIENCFTQAVICWIRLCVHELKLYFGILNFIGIILTYWNRIIIIIENLLESFKIMGYFFALCSYWLTLKSFFLNVCNSCVWLSNYLVLCHDYCCCICFFLCINFIFLNLFLQF